MLLTINETGKKTRVKKRKLAALLSWALESFKETDGSAMGESKHSEYIGAEVEKFLNLFERIFVAEAANNDSEDGLAGEILN